MSYLTYGYLGTATSVATIVGLYLLFTGGFAGDYSGLRRSSLPRLLHYQVKESLSTRGGSLESHLHMRGHC
jgi:hypothetical protein